MRRLHAALALLLAPVAAWAAPLSTEFDRTLNGTAYVSAPSLPTGGVLITFWSRVVPMGTFTTAGMRGNLVNFEIGSTTSGQEWNLIGITANNAAGNTDVNNMTFQCNAMADFTSAAWVADPEPVYWGPNSIRRTEFEGWVWNAWQIIPDDGTGSHNFIVRHWLRFGPAGAVFNTGHSFGGSNATVESALARADIRTASGVGTWTAGNATYLRLRQDNNNGHTGENGYLADARVYARSDLPTIAELTAISEDTDADTSAYADWTLTWSAGITLTDRSGNGRTLSSGGGTFYEGPEGPTMPTEASVLDYGRPVTKTVWGTAAANPNGVTVSGVTTPGANRTLVASIALSNTGGTKTPLGVSGGGLTWTQVDTVDTYQYGASAVWTAPAPSQISSPIDVTFTLSNPSTSDQSITAAVYSLAGSWTGSGVGKAGGDAAIALYRTFNPAGAGSFVVYAFTATDGTIGWFQAPRDGMKEDAQQAVTFGGGGLTAGLGHRLALTTGTSSITVGRNDTHDYSTVLAVELVPNNSSYSDSITESVAGSDALAHAATLPNATSDPISGSDTVAQAATFPHAVSESVAGAESHATAATFLESVADGVAGADAQGSTATLLAQLSESVAGGDSTEASVMSSGSCNAEPLRETGTVHYFCACGTGAGAGCTAGSDANDGLSPAAAKSSLSQAAALLGAISGGDTIAFCRTGAWSGTLGEFLNSNCSAGSPCDVRDYVPSWGSTSSPRPRFNVATGNFMSWDAGHGQFHGARVWNLDIRHATSDGYTFFAYAGSGALSQITDLDFCSLRIEGGAISFNLETVDYTARIGSGIQIRSSEIREVSTFGILGGAPAMNVDSNVWVNVGWPGPGFQKHTLYIGGASAGAHITNNDISVDTRCEGVIFVIHGIATDLVVENNRIASTSSNVNCYGIQSGESIAPFSDMSRSTFRRNRVQVNGQSAIEVSGCTDCVVSDNIAVGGRIAVGIQAGGGNLAATNNVTIQNNSVYIAGTFNGWAGVEISSGTGHLVDDNAVWINDATPSCYVTTGASRYSETYNACRDVGGVAASTWWVDVATNDFRPVASGPLDGTGDGTAGHYSATAIGTTAWSATDAGVSRAAPIDLGAMTTDGGGASYSDATTDAVAGGDGVVVAGTWPNALAESATGQDALDGGITIAATTSDAVTAADGLTASVVWAAAVGELVTSLDALATAQVSSDALAESVAAAATVVDQLNGGGTSYSDAVTEVLTAADVQASAATMAEALAEGLAAGEAIVDAASYPEVLAEGVTASDDATGGLLLAEALEEAVAAGDDQATQLACANALLEAVAASDAAPSTAIYGVTVVETVTAACTLTTGDLPPHTGLIEAYTTRPLIEVVLPR